MKATGALRTYEEVGILTRGLDLTMAVTVPKCCPLDSTYDYRNGTWTCHPHGSILEWNLTFHKRDLSLADLDYIVVHQNPGCSQFLLNHENPEEDQAYLLEDGSAFVPAWVNFDPPHGLYRSGDYCIDNDLSQQSSRGRPFLFLCFHDDPERPTPEWYTISTIVALVASDLSLFITLALMCVLPGMRNLYGKILMNHVTSLFLGYLALSVGKIGKPVPHHFTCQITGILVNFFFLSAFTWLTVMCYDMWRKFRKLLPPPGRTLTSRLIIIYCTIAWGGPLVVLTLSLILDYMPGIPDFVIKPNYGQDFQCWLKGWDSGLAYFYGPVAVMMVINLVLFVLTSVNICVARRDGQSTWRGVDNGRHTQFHQRQNRQRFIMYLKLFVVMGIPWICEVISWFGHSTLSSPLHYFYVSDLLNTLQGVLIFVVTLFKRQTLLKIRSKLAVLTKGFIGTSMVNSREESSGSARCTNVTPSIVMTDISTWISVKRKRQCSGNVPASQVVESVQ